MGGGDSDGLQYGYLCYNPNITTAELHNILGVSETAVENNISFLRKNEYIERVGSKKAGYWKVL